MGHRFLVHKKKKTDYVLVNAAAIHLFDLI